MDVALIQWPSEESLRRELAQQEHPRLLLVAPRADPPRCVDALEDWVRLPVSRADRAARIEGLVERTGRLEKMMPGLGHDGTLHYRGATAQLSETQTRVMLSLIERFGAVVSRGELTARAWPDVVVPDNNLDVTVGRLRRRLVLVGLRIRTVRSRGYLLFDPEASL